MNKYKVTILIDACNGVSVEAETPEEAANLAYDSEKSYASLCHHCSSEIEMGDCTGVIVYDESGEEVFNDTYHDVMTKSLEAKVKELESKLVEANNG